MKTAGNGETMSRRSMSWAWISGIAFLISFLASGLLIFFGKRLEELGITGNIYYIILVPLGFSCAAFLAGAMKSYASYKSNAPAPYGTLNLSGPIVIFVLVVGGGFIMPGLNKKAQFDVKMRIVSKDRPTAQFNEGFIYVYVGKDHRRYEVHEGEITIPNIPETFNNKTLKIDPAIPDYQLAGPDEVKVSRNQDYVDIVVTKNEESMRTAIRGSVMNGKGAVVKDALLDFESGLATCRTDQDGNFSLTVPLREGQKPRLKIFVDGIMRFYEPVTISAMIPIEIKLDQAP